jgi:hypothetical protein
MHMLPQPATPLRAAKVSYTLALTQSARRIARLIPGAEPHTLERVAVDTYRATGNPHDGKRALRDSAEVLKRGGLRA